MISNSDTSKYIIIPFPLKSSKTKNQNNKPTKHQMFWFLQSLYVDTSSLKKNELEQACKIRRNNISYHNNNLEEMIKDNGYR